MDSTRTTAPDHEALAGPRSNNSNARTASIRRRRKKGLRFTRVKNERAKKAKARAAKSIPSGGGAGKRAGTSTRTKKRTKSSLVTKERTVEQRRRVREGSPNSVVVTTRTLRSRTLEIVQQKAAKVKRYRSLAPEPSEGLIQAERERELLASPPQFEDNPIALAPFSMSGPGNRTQNESAASRAINEDEEYEMLSNDEMESTNYAPADPNSFEGATNPVNEINGTGTVPPPMPTNEAGPPGRIPVEDDGHNRNNISARSSSDREDITMDTPTLAYASHTSQQGEDVNKGRHRRRVYRRTGNAFFGDPRGDDTPSCPPEEPAPLPMIRLYDRRPFIAQTLQSHETTIVRDRPDDSLYWFTG